MPLDEVHPSFPAEVRPAGEGPFWQPGDVILWQERTPHWRPGEPWSTTPVRVVQDDADGLVVWLAPATVYLMPRLADGAGLRSLPLDEMFRAPLVRARVAWRGPGILRLAPTRTPWSVWLFWTVEGQFEGWYVNLEHPHARQPGSTWTCDHELDVWIEAGGAVHLKDAEELTAAVAAGRFTAAEADLIHSRVAAVRAAYAERAWYFADEWTRWRPPADWPTPELPAGVTWDLDTLEPNAEA